MAEKIEIKETLSRELFSKFLRELADAMEKTTDFQTIVKGQLLTIPTQGMLKAEFESKGEAEEFEVKLKLESAA